ncbi:reverse transcriptase domain-containing protein, partial [Tanacetum coccineum]
PGIREIQAVPSTAHGILKFLVGGGVVTIRSTILTPNEYATIMATSKDSMKKIEGGQENVKVAIHHDFPDQEVALGGTLSIEGRTTLCALLKRNLDIFAWQPSDMTGKKRGQAPERAKAIQAEVQKLVKAGIMRAVYYHDWLSYPVMVKKHDGSWRMCVDFTNLNKACPQDCYPLLEIDWKVESLCGYPFKCFLDAYKGYHQIQMAEEDEEKTAFHTPHGVYCYTKMPFGLKNAGATYQRLVDKAFEKQVGRNLEVYVDDLVIKSHTEAELLRDIEETFRTLRKINMKLNPKKCTFGAVEGMFLGYMIGPEGIKPCPEKIEAVLQLPSPRTVKEVQSLNGKLAGLNRFLSKSAEKSLPLFKTLKKCVKKSDFRWTPEAEQAFKQLKQHISELPMLVAPRPKEELIMYLSASQGAVGAVLMTERDSIQTPVYFVSRALQGPELNYTPMEKLVLALVFAAKRLRRYFQAHPIAVITDQPIRQVMSRPEVAGRLQKWSIMLGEHNITYRPRTSVKGQILADFLVEKPEEASADMSEKEAPQEPWTLFTDGSSCIDGSGAGLILTSPEGAEFTYALRFQFTASNNEAEYEALLAGLRIAAQMGVRNIRVSVDSKLVANQVLGTYIAKEENMIKYLEKSRSIQEKSIQEKEVAAVVEEEGPTWMTPITEYLKDGVLPDDKKEANKLRIKARQYELMDGILYRRSFLRPWLRDTRDMILKCKDCQVHRPVPRNPQQPLTPITSPWPFYKWVIDIAGPFPEGPGKKFVWDNIVCRFGLLGEIVSDNGKQFSDNPFKDWCEKLNITHRFASVKHPQSNGLVEIANRSLGKGIKARLGNYRRRRALHKRMDEFMIVRSPSPYNGIIGRPGIREIQAVPSTAHGMLKFLVNGGVVTIRSTILTPNECATITATSKDSIKKIERGQENLKVAIHPDFPDQEVALEGTLSIEGRTVLCILLKMNLDIFTWQPSDMTGVPRQIAKHRLNIRDGYPPVRQKKRGQAPERAKAIQAEVQKLVKAGIMREVYYHDWLSNPVMVKKHDGSWRICVDFTNLNKACPQDCYPLPEID